jgi:hypothetical protein
MSEKVGQVPELEHFITMLKVVVGHSNDPDSQIATEEILAQCHAELAGLSPKAGILFAAIDFEHSVILQRILAVFPGLELIGGSTDGEVSSVLGFQEDSLLLLLFCSDTIEMRAGVGRVMSQNPLAGAQQAVTQAQADGFADVKLCLAIPDGFLGSGVSIINSLKQALSSSVPIIGGMAGDQWRFQQTYQFFGSEVLSDAMPILLFSGELFVSHGVASGWQPISRKAKVTKVEGAVVHEIDHKPAIEFYDFYLKGLSISGNYPLAVFEENNQEFYLRAPKQSDLDQGSVLFMGDVPEQATVQITHASCDEIIAATQTSIEKALFNYPGKHPAAALLFSCAARRWLLGSRTHEEYDFSQQVLNSQVPIFGFYTYGEIAPLTPGGETRYHQETLVTLLIGVE